MNHFYKYQRLTRGFFLWCICSFSLLYAQPQQSQKKYVLKANRPICTSRKVLDDLFELYSGNILLGALYEGIIKGTRYEIEKLPKGTTVYVGEKISTSYTVETFNRRVPVSIWKIRVSEIDKPKLKGRVSKILDTKFLFMVYHKEVEVEISEEEKIFLKNKQIAQQRARKEATQKRRAAQKARKEAEQKKLAEQRVREEAEQKKRAEQRVREEAERRKRAEKDAQVKRLVDAVRAGQTDIVRGLLQQGVDPEARSKYGPSAIAVAEAQEYRYIFSKDKVQEDKNILCLLYAYRGTYKSKDEQKRRAEQCAREEAEQKRRVEQHAREEAEQKKRAEKAAQVKRLVAGVALIAILLVSYMWDDPSK